MWGEDNGYLTVEKIREEVLDTDPEKNLIDCDLVFSDRDIINAMKRAARDFNNIPPTTVYRVAWNCMPDDTNIFMDATISRLLNMHTYRLMNNVAEYTTGGTTVNLFEKRLQLYETKRRELEERWRTNALILKREVNLDYGFGFY